MKILHIAPFNIAGIPLTFVKAEKKLGFHSRLITLGKEKQNREKDICLNLPFIYTENVKKILFMNRVYQDGKEKTYNSIPPVWFPENNIAKKLIQLRDKIWENRLRKFFSKFDIYQFDIYQLDSGLGFLRNAKFIKNLKQKNKKIICCYLGSDLRLRGVIPEVDEISDLNITVEYDHLKLHPAIYHIPFPFDTTQFKPVEKKPLKKIIIGHAPTNRKAKGTDIIISTVEKLKKDYNVELLLIENLPYKKAIALKKECNLFIDQISELGYGINSLEAFALGIPVLSSLSEEFKTLCPGHPFIEVDNENLYDRLFYILKNPESLSELGLKGRKWVEEFHNPVNVVKKIHKLLKNV